MKLCFLVCWFGPYPWYFRYFIHSCAYNPTIDFIIITDNEESIPGKSQNVRTIYKKLAEIKSIASGKLGFEVNLDYAYKLCEFKPTYGFLFPEIIKGYDFWGSGDIDIIFGNIRDFLTEEMLQQYDYISLRHDYTTGCFSLFRNNLQMNRFFMGSKDYRFVFSDPRYHNFDECGFAFPDLHEGRSIFESKSRIESFTHIVKMANERKEIRAHFDFILMEGATGRVRFENGRILYKNKLEAILYHLVTFKQTCVVPKTVREIPDCYVFSPTRIYHRKKQKNSTLNKHD